MSGATQDRTVDRTTPLACDTSAHPLLYPSTAHTTAILWLKLEVDASCRHLSNIQVLIITLFLVHISAKCAWAVPYLQQNTHIFDWDFMHSVSPL